MSIVKSFSVGDGDMFYIKHNTDNFSIIDCNLSDINKESITNEIKEESLYKNIKRFISTHPDDDHICGLEYFDDETNILNFYCVDNEATKEDESSDFKRYRELRDSEKAFHLYRDCKRCWMNKNDSNNERKHSGIHILWPIIDNEYYKQELENSKNAESPNNISIIMNYSAYNISFLWMGDLKNEFMENIKDEIILPKVNVLFAPHHGRKSGNVPQKWLDQMDPDIIVIGEAPSENIDYSHYADYNTINQNSAHDITFDCYSSKKVHIYVSNSNYSVDFLDDENMSTYVFYIGTLNT